LLCHHRTSRSSPTGALPSRLLSGGETITASFTVTNTGQREGADVPQLYLTNTPDEKRMRLIGFEHVAAGRIPQLTLAADPRLLARFDAGRDQWRIADGAHAVAIGKSANDLGRAKTRLLKR
jgi:beta-glucosidase